MSARPPRLATLSVFALLLAAPRAFAQARITAADGKVEVSPAGLPAWIAVSTPPYVLKDGDRVRTADGASARISFPDASRVDLEGGAAFSVEKVKKGDAALRLDAGALKASVAKGLSRHFRVATPTAVAAAHGTAFSVRVTPTQDTQVEVDDGVVGVKLKNGEETELGTDRPYRSLLVLPGRSLALLPHPNEDAPAAKRSSLKTTDCLHAPNGAVRGSVEEIEACQGRARARRPAMTSSEDATLREHERAEIKRFLRASGDLPDDGLDQTVDGGDPGAPDAAPAGGRNMSAESSALMKELGLPDSAAANPLDSLTPEKIQFLKDALAKQGANPGIQQAFKQATSGGNPLTDEQFLTLLKSLKLDQLKLDPAQKANLPPLDDAPPAPADQ